MLIRIDNPIVPKQEFTLTMFSLAHNKTTCNRQRQEAYRFFKHGNRDIKFRLLQLSLVININQFHKILGW